ncbi:MAG TPA: endolytic transglycosylase MltG [Sulfurovum sp.]|uniref:endolytic transglycosylase MltG n=1 Tax=Sulfurovum sp. TaxID=1969726 RepID=UPI002F9229EA
MFIKKTLTTLTKRYRHFVFYFQLYVIILLVPIAYNAVPVNEGTRTFYIASSHIDDVVETLKSNGYEVTWFDKMMLMFRKTPTEGWYSVEPRKYGRILFFQHLYKQKTKDLMDVVVYAGETKDELSARLSNDMKLDQQKLLKVYKSLARFEEADILAGRYTIARKADEDATMKYIFLASDRTWEKLLEESFDVMPDAMKLKMLYIVASIIQKESNSVLEMPLISSVIYNRLEQGMKLQMDGTLNYGKYSRTIVTPQRIKSDKSRYNTYKYKGLPPDPLCTVSIDALKASMQPAESNYLFFMLNSSGTHDFTETYKEHLQNIRSFRVYLAERGKQKSAKVHEIKPVDRTNLSVKSVDKNTTVN